MDTQPNEQTSRLIRLPEVKALTGLGKSTIYELQGIGDFPQSVSISARCVGWVREEVNAWILSRIERRKAIR
ncbi:MAG: AlpA family transcriptional regulator [Alphaproteobacteria bacterium]|nr:AlpA family transcriptional regulator [Alphaproteobacteria bacterium]